MGFKIRNKWVDRYTNEEGLTEVIIPDGVDTIAMSAFEGVAGIENVVIPEGVTYIRDGAFRNCKDLKEVRLPSTLKKVGICAFADCPKLVTIEIPDGIQKIEYNAFKNCKTIVYRGITAPCRHNRLSVVNTVIYTIRTLDFNTILPTDIKHKITWELMFAYPNNEEVIKLARRHFTRLFKEAVDNNDFEKVKRACELDGYLTKSNIDKLMEYARENNRTEIFVMLLQYKNDKIGFSKPNLFL